MKHYREIKDREEYQAFVSDMTGQTPAPGGECMAGFRARIHQGFEELKVSHYQQVLRLRNREQMAATVAVIHGGPISSIMDELYPGEYDNFYYWTPDPGHGYILTLEDAGITGYERF